jgi:hypothetical protein
MRKRTTMSVWMVLTMALTAMAGASPAHADQMLTTTVPFDFIVGDARLPAGDYIVTELPQQGMVSIASKDSEHTAFVLTVRAIFDREEASTPELVFETFGGQHFLSQIIGERNQGREILLTPEIMTRELERIGLPLKR